MAATLVFGVSCASDRADDGADGRASAARPAPAPVVAVATTELRSVTGAQFERQVLDADQPVVVEFGAAWCHHCRELGDVVRGLTAGVTPARVVTVDVDRDPALAERYAIETLPTLTVFVAGAAIGELRGVHQRDELAPLFSVLGRPGSPAQVAELRALLNAVDAAGAGDSCSVQGSGSRAAACELPPCESC